MADIINGRIKLKQDTTENWNKVGGKFAPLKGELIIYTDYRTSQTGFNIYDDALAPIEQGSISGATGQDAATTIRLRTKDFIEVNSVKQYTIKTNIPRVYVFFYAANGTYLSPIGEWMNVPCTFTTPLNCKKIRLVLAMNENVEMRPSDVQWLRVEEQRTTFIPGLKIGNGNAYVGDLPFVDDDTRDLLLSHIQNNEVHVTPNEKTFWSGKVDIDESFGEVYDDTLIFTRDDWRGILNG